MGAFYGSVHVKTDDVDSVKRAVAQLATRTGQCLIAPPIAGWIAIYPNDSGQSERASKAIAKKLDAPVLHVMVHDDDVFCYWYYRNHKLVDRFNSCPDYFGDVSDKMKSRQRGRPELLADLLPRPDDLPELESVLSAMRDEAPFLSAGPQLFVDLFQLLHALTSYDDLMAGETAGIDEWSQFVHLPDLTDELKREREQADELRRAKDRLKDQGLLVAELTMGMVSTSFSSTGQVTGQSVPHAIWCCDAVHGLIAVIRNFGDRDDVPVFQYGPSGIDQATVIGNVRPGSCSLASSAVSNLLAIGGIADRAGRVELRDLIHGTTILEVQHATPVRAVGFSTDACMFYSLSWTELIGTEIESQQRIVELAVNRGTALDLHPSGKLVAVTQEHSAAVFDLSTGTQRTIRLSVDPVSKLQDLLPQLTKDMPQLDSNGLRDQVRWEFEQLGVPPDSAPAQWMVGAIEKAMAEILGGTLLPHLTRPAFQPEGFYNVKFADRGRFVCCATTEGLRVFETEAVLSSGEDELAPRFRAHLPPLSNPGSSLHPIYALVDDPQRQRVIYGGIDGVIRALDLSTGETHVLAEIPGAPSIVDMRLVEHQLYCGCDLNFPPRHSGKYQPPIIQIWDLDQLSEGS